MEITDKEYEILESIHKGEETLRQRDLAQVAGLSLGMTNSILKRLAEKGWITMKRINSRNIHYMVTPSGIEMISIRSYQYFKRTIKNIVLYKDAIDQVVLRAKAEGYESVVLQGESDLDFVIEHCCREAGVQFIRNSADEGAWEMVSETVEELEVKEGQFWLRDICK